jgi:hypothetical protein
MSYSSNYGINFNEGPSSNQKQNYSYLSGFGGDELQVGTKEDIDISELQNYIYSPA